MLDYDNASVAIALTTSYPKWYKGKLRSLKQTDKIRGDLALELIKISCERGYKVVVADWKSPRSFRKELQNSKVLLIRRQIEKRSPAKRQAIKKASKIPGVKVIVLTEPEKVSLIRDCLAQIVTPILKEQADIVVPKRNDELFKETYPDYMYESEVEGNSIYNEELKSHKLIELNEGFDMFFGPRVFANKRSILSLFLKRYRFGIGHTQSPWYFDAEELSNTNFFPIVAALKKGFRVLNIEVPFKYPALQKENEDKGSREFFIEKRKGQKMGVVIELLHFVAFLEKYRGVRIKE